jgi:uroporphyrinogen decarboxylase
MEKNMARKNELRPKERVRLAVEHIEPDRPPIQVYLTPEIRRKLSEHFKGCNLQEVLGVDFRGVGPRALKPVKKPKPGSNIDSYDIWSIGYKNVRYSMGTYPEAMHLPFRDMKTMDEVDAYPWPSPDDFDYSVIPAQCEALADYAVCAGGAGIPDIVNGVSRGRGMEQVVMDIEMEDEVGVAVIDHRVDFYYEYCRRILEAAVGKIDILCLGEDCGTQNGPLFSPASFNRFFRPRIQKFIQLAHEFGAYAMLHSCGSNRALMPTFIEMGLDIEDAMQPEPAGMDPEEIKNEFGSRLTFCGLISTQETLPYGTVEDCRAEALHRIRVIGRNGGYIFAPAHCIQPDTPLENILTIYEVANSVERLGQGIGHRESQSSFRPQYERAWEKSTAHM